MASSDTCVEVKSIIVNNILYTINDNRVDLSSINGLSLFQTFIERYATIIKILVHNMHLYALLANGTIRDWAIDNNNYYRPLITSDRWLYIKDFSIDGTSLLVIFVDNTFQKYPLSI